MQARSAYESGSPSVHGSNLFLFASMGCATSSDLVGEVHDRHHRYSSLELHDLIYPDQSKKAVAANEKAIFGTDGVILVDPAAPPKKSAGPLASDSREIRSDYEVKADNVKVAAHARIRPLQPFEKDAGARAVNVPFAVASAAGKDPNQAGSDSANIPGFTSTLGPEVANRATFEATFAKQVSRCKRAPYVACVARVWASPAVFVSHLSIYLSVPLSLPSPASALSLYRARERLIVKSGRRNPHSVAPREE